MKEQTFTPLQPLIYDLSSPGREGVKLPKLDVPAADLPEGFARSGLDLPEVGELQAVRNFTGLSHLNFSIDGNLYPLGSLNDLAVIVQHQDAARGGVGTLQHVLQHLLQHIP